MTSDHIPVRKIFWVFLFAVAFAFVESSVVVYLRALYYPEGFTLPLKHITSRDAAVEVSREAATILMLVAVGVIAGRKGWQRFGYFCVAFGVWDIFYYVWLKVILNWPASLTEWDILFLIPLPWLGPVLSAVLVALLMTIFGLDIVVRTALHKHFRPTLLSWSAAILASILILYSFMHDTAASLGGAVPLPYRYELLSLGLVLYIAGYVVAVRQPQGARGRT